ncbi:MAG TPA: L-histidine N(alpha)-methyltransferase [Flavobacteriales bacterium]|nr:L-histidine N(alpha)-methyltransferase [Flavobacteriales bacterium]
MQKTEFMILTETTLDLVTEAVKKGLSKYPKRLPSWLFYDEKGDKIFQSIMAMPEYYLTGCEYEIFELYKEDLLQDFTRKGDVFRLVELGAGDGLKTEVLLRHFVAKKAAFSFQPIDASETVLEQLEKRLKKSVPLLEINAIIGQYETGLKHVSQAAGSRAVYMFLGANIGNFTLGQSSDLMEKIATAMRNDDLLLVGFDLKKNPHTILAAYNDKTGITRDFNLNLLTRLNCELGADFDVKKFTHYPCYDPASGTTKSYLVSSVKQEVFVEALNESFSFEEGEYIHTEISQKFDLPMIEKLARENGLEIAKYYFDSRKYFVDVLFEKK